MNAVVLYNRLKYSKHFSKIMDNGPKGLCRTCLKEGAIIPIFDGSGDQSIYSKLSLCLQEQIRDIAGFPRNICEICSKTLDVACKFIQKYRESHKVLENSLFIVKQERDYLSDCSYNDVSETEIDIAVSEKKEVIKLEYDGILEDPTNILSKLQPLPIVIKKIKKEPELIIKKVRKKKKKVIKSRSNGLASLLEGDFRWNGNKWCLKSKKAILKNCNAKRDRLPKIIVSQTREKDSDPPKLCDLCGEVFDTHNKLLHHKKTKHEIRIPVKCPHCPRRLISDYYLRKHITRVHQDRPHMCALCGSKFAFIAELRSHHKNVHEKHLKPKKIYKCSKCDKTYKCSKSVLVHERSVHLDLRPAVCDVCGSSFYHEDYLKEHMRLHTGETPFKCPICSRGYAQRGNMKSHMIHNHKLADIDEAVLREIQPSSSIIHQPSRKGIKTLQLFGFGLLIDSRL